MWTIEYENDTGPGDESFIEWWNVIKGNESFRCSTEVSAVWLCDVLNNYSIFPIYWAEL